MSFSQLFAAVRVLISDHKAVTALEDGILASLIIVVCIGIITTLGTNLSTRLGEIGTAL